MKFFGDSLSLVRDRDGCGSGASVTCTSPGAARQSSAKGIKMGVGGGGEERREDCT